MKNLFVGIEITFPEQLFDNSQHNAHFDRDGFRQYMLPEKESSVARFLREFEGFVRTNGLKREYEHTVRKDGVVTLYFSGKPDAWTRDFLKRCEMLTSVTYGSMKDNATFRPYKAA